MDTSALLQLLGSGLDVYDAYSQGQTQDSYAGLLQDREDYNYAQAQNNYNAYNDYNDMAYGIAQGNAAAADARAGAIGGAFAASEAGRLKASKKARKGLKKTHKKSLSYLTPYRVTGEAMIAPTLNMWNQGMEGMNLLNAYMNTPKQIAKLDQGGPILSMGNKLGKLPEWMTK